MTAEETRKLVQRLLLVKDDGVLGPKSNASYEALKTAEGEWGNASPPQNAESGDCTETGVKVPQQAIEIIKEFESCLKPSGENDCGEQLYTSYPDPGYGWNLPTIGWGTVAYENGDKVKRGDAITQSRADELLLWEVKEKAEGVDKLVTVPLTDNERGALISFAYNVGLDDDSDILPEGLGDSTLLKKLNSGDKAGAAKEFLKWDKSNGETLKGLTRRREAERKLFLT